MLITKWEAKDIDDVKMVLYNMLAETKDQLADAKEYGNIDDQTLAYHDQFFIEKVFEKLGWEV